MSITDSDITTLVPEARTWWRRIVQESARARGSRPAALSIAQPAEIAPPISNGVAEDFRRPHPKAPRSRAINDAAHMASTLQQVSGDLATLALDDGESSAGGGDPWADVRRIKAQLDAAARALEARRPAFVDAQLARLGLSSKSRGLKLHIGSGDSPIAGWINIDSAPADLTMDLRWGLPFANGAADKIFLCHVLEHFYYPNEALLILQDLRRVLAAGGKLRVVVPDIERCIQAYARADTTFFQARRRTWSWWPTPQTHLESFLEYAGANTDPGDLTDSHKFGYDFETLSRLLTRAGFGDVKRSQFMGSADPDLRVDTNSAVAAARFGEQFYSLFVEASR